MRSRWYEMFMECKRREEREGVFVVRRKLMEWVKRVKQALNAGGVLHCHNMLLFLSCSFTFSLVHFFKHIHIHFCITYTYLLTYSGVSWSAKLFVYLRVFVWGQSLIFLLPLANLILTTLVTHHYCTISTAVYSDICRAYNTIVWRNIRKSYSDDIHLLIKTLLDMTHTLTW